LTMGQPTGCRIRVILKAEQVFGAELLRLCSKPLKQLVSISDQWPINQIDSAHA
jgi:hypothetical protein